MDMDLVRDTLETVIPALVPGVQVQWNDAARAFSQYPINVTMRIFGVRELGVPNRAIKVNDPPVSGEELTEVIQTVEEFTLSLRAESLVHDNDKTCFGALEQIKSRLAWTSTREALKAGALAYVNVSLPTTDLSELSPIDQRNRSIAVLDLRFRVSSQTDGEKLTYIETIEVTGP